MYRETGKCRICGNTDLQEVLDLGVQALTGVFPRTRSEPVTRGPLRLVRCNGADACGLLQLGHSYDLGELYGDNYGYRSGLNASMVDHLQKKVAAILKRVRIDCDSLVIDIGSNDATTLRAYPASGATLVGVDPSGRKFSRFYPPGIQLLPDFFSSSVIRAAFGNRKATVVTSFSMFYDLEDPLQFMREVAEVLDERGIWVFEQSYMPTMLARNSYDTVCHEHLEYYALRQVMWMADRAGLEIVDVELNDVNGGSFSVVAARRGSGRVPSPAVAAAMEAENRLGLQTPRPYAEFARRVTESRETLRNFVHDATRSGKSVAGLGASTKGNVILQYCGLTADDISAIGEVNEDKFGCFTPGTLIPIAPESDVLAEQPDYLIVLPWHFRRFFQNDPRFASRRLVFPLPALEIV
jgi:NDP-4-keto-2,6-dideoxyhexose 3-C-methyltransferase